MLFRLDSFTRTYFVILISFKSSNVSHNPHVQWITALVVSLSSNIVLECSVPYVDILLIPKLCCTLSWVLLSLIKCLFPYSLSHLIFEPH